MNLPLPQGIDPQPITHAALSALATGAGLIPEQEYKITDFRTRTLLYGNTGAAAYDELTTYQPYEMSLYEGKVYQASQESTGNLPTNATYWTALWDLYQTGDTEALIVRANSTSTLYRESRSTVYPADVIYYELTDTTPEAVGDRGRIIYRERRTAYQHIEMWEDWLSTKDLRFMDSVSGNYVLLDMPLGAAADYQLWPTFADIALVVSCTMRQHQTSLSMSRHRNIFRSSVTYFHAEEQCERNTFLGQAGRTTACSEFADNRFHGNCVENAFGCCNSGIDCRAPFRKTITSDNFSSSVFKAQVRGLHIIRSNISNFTSEDTLYDSVIGCDVTGATINTGYGTVDGKSALSTGSDIPVTIDATGASTIDLSAHIYAGIFDITSTNATETITAITQAAWTFPVRIRPASGLTLTLTAGAGCFTPLNGAGNAVLNGTNGDWIDLLWDGAALKEVRRANY